MAGFPQTAATESRQSSDDAPDARRSFSMLFLDFVSDRISEGVILRFKIPTRETASRTGRGI